jgi:hypothetical protein
MRNVITLCVAGAILSAGAAKPITVAGLAYSIGDPDENFNAPADPVDGATVTLYKRTPEGSWEQVGSSTTTSDQGYYHFDNVSTMGTAWFKVRFDAEGSLPGGWEHADVLERVAYKEVRPSGIPDAGIIRVDVVFADSEQLLTEEPEDPWFYGFQGRYVYLDPTTGVPVAPDMGEGAGTSYLWHLGTCPPTENAYAFGGCRAGDWWSHCEHDVSEYFVDAGWAHYVYYYPSVPLHEAGSFGEGYYYWSPELPWWTLHGNQSQALAADRVQKVDIIEIALPE